MSEPSRRKLAAIVAADVAGYSRLIGQDEDGTLATLRRIRQELVAPRLAEHGGRIANTAGDSYLFEFPSAVDAVRCAIAVQQAMADDDAPVDRRVQFRIGVHIGDVIAEGDDLLGDGVNVAARLEGLCEPGGIALSDDAYRQVRDRVTTAWQDSGEHHLKNIARTVQVWRWAEHAAPEATAAAETVDPDRMAYKLPTMPSIAVLPFDNLSGDPAQDYLGDGLSENIIAVLATSPDLLVIARNSSFIFKGKATRVQDVAEACGVRYVLEGSVQSAGNRIRVTAQLVDAVDGKHLWAERYDRDLDDLFAVQDDIANRIFVALRTKLVRGGSISGREQKLDLEAYRLNARIVHAIERYTPDSFRDAEQLIATAMERFPDQSWTYGTLAAIHWQRVNLGFSKDVATDMQRAKELATKAHALDPGNPQPVYTLGLIAATEGDYDGASDLADQARELDPSFGYTQGVCGLVKSWCGRYDEANELFHLGMRLMPLYPSWLPLCLGLNHLMRGAVDEARDLFASLATEPGTDPALANVRCHSWEALAVIAAWRDDLETARAYLENVRDATPRRTIRLVAFVLCHVRDQDFVACYLEALRAAGLPE